MNTVQAFDKLYQTYQNQEWSKTWSQIVMAVRNPALLYYFIEYEELEPEKLLDPPDLYVYPGTFEDLQTNYLNHFQIPDLVRSIIPGPQFAIALIEEGYEQIKFQDQLYVVGPDINELAGIHQSRMTPQITLIWEEK